MIRGKTLFKCCKCGKFFIATDIEYKATIYSVPQACNRCGSIKTLHIYGILRYKTYKKIWKEME